MGSQYPPFFSRFKKRATEIIKNPGKVLDELSKADTKVENHRNEVKKFVEDLKTLIRLVRAWAKGEYTEIPTTTVILVVAAITYFVSPIDAIPDWIPIFGYLDDAGVIAVTIRSFGGDIADFQSWEKGRKK